MAIMTSLKTLVQAYTGLDRLVLIPSPDIRPGMRGARLVAAIDAAATAGVEHLLLVSSSGTKRAQGTAQLLRRLWESRLNQLATFQECEVIKEASSVAA